MISRSWQRGIIVFAVYVLVSSSALAQRSPFLRASSASSGGLVPARFSSFTDPQGYYWYAQSSYGSFNGSSSRNCFSNFGMLLINNSTFSSSQQMMTADGSEYHFNNTVNNVAVNRRMKIDKVKSYVRYIDSFTNTKSNAVTLSVQYQVQLRYSTSNVTTNAGKVFNGTFSKSDVGLVFESTKSGAADLLAYFVDKRGKVRPSVQKQSTQYKITYSLEIPAGQTVTLVTAYSQRKLNAVDAKVWKKEFELFKTRELLQDVSKDVKKLVRNLSVSSWDGTFDRLPLLHRTLDLADYWEVERGASDILVVDEETKVEGRLQDGNLEIDTALGNVEVKISDLASIVGSLNDTRLFLRNGEILVGSITENASLTLVAEDDLTMQLDPKRVNALFTNCNQQTDGKAEDNVGALVETSSGQRLALAMSDSLKISVGTAWGPAEIPISQIRLLRSIQEPQPVFRLLLIDGSEFDVLLRGSSWKQKSLRFEDVELFPAEISMIVNPHAPTVLVESDADPKPVPHVILVGENRLAGKLEATKLRFESLGSESEITTADVRSVTPVSGDDDTAKFRIELASGKSLTGRFVDSSLAFQSMGRTWTLRPEQIESIENPAPPEVKSAKPPEAEGNAPNAETPEANATGSSTPNRARPAPQPSNTADPFGSPAPSTAPSNTFNPFQ